MRELKPVAVVALFSCAALSLVSGCVSKGTAGKQEVPGPVNRCSEPKGCGTGYACDLGTGLCSAPGPRSSDVILKILTGSDPVPRLFAMTLSRSEKLATILIDKALPLSGRVWTASPSPSTLEADLRFRPVVDSDMAIDPADVLVRSSREAGQDGSNFTILMPPGRYEVEIWPVDPQGKPMPPVYGEVSVESSLQRLEFEIPMPIRVDGWVTQGNEPLTGAQVWAEDDRGRRISTLAESDNDCRDAGSGPDSGLDGGSDGGPCGSFELEVISEKSALYMRVDLPDVPFFPEYRTGPYDLEQDASVGDIGNIALPNPGVPCVFSADVQGLDEHKRLIGVEDVAVTFNGKNIAGGEVTRVLHTDAEGAFIEEVQGWMDAGTGAYLLNGEYEVTLIPAADSLFAAYKPESPVVVTGGGGVQEGMVFTLPGKLSLKGRLFAGPGQEGFPNTTVKALPRGSSTIAQRPSSALTGASGTFDLTLDPGPYVLVCESPIENGFPWIWDLKEPSPGSGTVQLEALPPFLWKGKIAFRDGSPASGMKLEAYIRPAQDTPPILIARSVSNDQGEFTILLPGSP